MADFWSLLWIEKNGKKRKPFLKFYLFIYFSKKAKKKKYSGQ